MLLSKDAPTLPLLSGPVLFPLDAYNSSLNLHLGVSVNILHKPIGCARDQGADWRPLVIHDI